MIALSSLETPHVVTQWLHSLCRPWFLLSWHPDPPTLDLKLIIIPRQINTCAGFPHFGKQTPNA